MAEQPKLNPFNPFIALKTYPMGVKPAAEAGTQTEENKPDEGREKPPVDSGYLRRFQGKF